MNAATPYIGSNDSTPISASAPTLSPPSIREVVTPQAVSGTQGSMSTTATKTASPRQDAGVSLQISGKSGNRVQPDLNRVIAYNAQGREAGGSADPLGVNNSEQAQSKATSLLQDSLQKLEEEQRARKSRLEDLIAKDNAYADTTPGNTPEETILKARVLRSRVSQSSQSDPENAKIVAKAAQMEAEAKAKITERQRQASGIETDPVGLLERAAENSRDTKILEKIGSTYGLNGAQEASKLVAELA